MNPQEENTEVFSNENFSTRFARYVDQSTLSQKQLAEALGVAESAIVNYKNGRIPRAPELFRIARFFDVSMEMLLTGHDPAAEGLMLAGNSRETDWQTVPGGSFTGESEESLLKRIDLMPPEELQAQFAFFEGTIQELRQRAEVFNEFATNLLIEAKRLETMLQTMRNAHNALVRSGHIAAREFERRREKAQGAESE